MIDNRRISIIVRTKDRPRLLHRTLESIKSQTYKQWQIILINNGGSTTEVEEVIKELNLQDRIIYRVLEEQYLMEYATNKGLEVVETEYITMLDDDDTWEINYLEDTIGVLESNKEIAGVVCLTNIIEEEIKGEGIIINNKYLMNPDLKKINKWSILRCNQFTTNSFVYRKAAINQLKQYDDALPVLGDWDFNIRFVMNNLYIKVISQGLSNYHKRQTANGSYSNSNQSAHLKYDWIIRKKYSRELFDKGNILLSIWCLSIGLAIRLKTNIIKRR